MDLLECPETLMKKEGKPRLRISFVHFPNCWPSCSRDLTTKDDYTITPLPERTPAEAGSKRLPCLEEDAPWCCEVEEKGILGQEPADSKKMKKINDVGRSPSPQSGRPLCKFSDVLLLDSHLLHMLQNSVLHFIIHVFSLNP